MDNEEQPTEAQSTPENVEGETTPNNKGEESRHCDPERSEGEATSTDKEGDATPDGKSETTSTGKEGEAAGSEATSQSADKRTDVAAENAKLRDQLLRLAADFDNYRKRMIKEKADAIEYANENLLGDLLDPLDNLERTVDAADKAQDPKAIAEGVKMTLGALVKVLGEKYGLAAFGAAGEKFNPDLHQAIGRTPAGEGEDVAEPTIKEVYQKGYKLHERVIRHAKVMVITPAEKKE